MTPHSSAAASIGTFQVMSSTKRTHVAKSFLQFSKMVPDMMPKRVPHTAHLSLRWPAGVLPSLAVRGDLQRGQAGCGLNASAASSKVP